MEHGTRDNRWDHVRRSGRAAVAAAALQALAFVAPAAAETAEPPAAATDASPPVEAAATPTPVAAPPVATPSPPVETQAAPETTPRTAATPDPLGGAPEASTSAVEKRVSELAGGARRAVTERIGDAGDMPLTESVRQTAAGTVAASGDFVDEKLRGASAPLGNTPFGKTGPTSSAPAPRTAGRSPVLPASHTVSIPAPDGGGRDAEIFKGGLPVTYMAPSEEATDAAVRGLLREAVRIGAGRPTASVPPIAGPFPDSASGDFSAGSSPSPTTPVPPFEAPATASGSGGTSFIPLAALLALLALAAPATFRRRPEAPIALAPTRFVCALERPG